MKWGGLTVWTELSSTRDALPPPHPTPPRRAVPCQPLGWLVMYGTCGTTHMRDKRS